jgi:hypothetical protein
MSRSSYHSSWACFCFSVLAFERREVKTLASLSAQGFYNPRHSFSSTCFHYIQHSLPTTYHTRSRYTHTHFRVSITATLILWACGQHSFNARNTRFRPLIFIHSLHFLHLHCTAFASGACYGLFLLLGHKASAAYMYSTGAFLG